MEQTENKTQEANDENALDPITNELLSHDWEEIYGVLFSIKEVADQRPQKTLQFLVENPKFAMALYQAQMELGIACTQLPSEPVTFSNTVDHLNWGKDQYQRYLTMTLGEFYTLTPDQQEYVKMYRASYGYTPIPIQ